jgi:putative ABC transport system permease protein
MSLAVVTAITAARWPARSAARISIVAALSGRPAPPRPARRSAVRGTLLLVGGLVILALFGGWGSGRTLFLVPGIVATTIGGLLLVPLAIAGLAAAGRRAPIAVRLALRDLARYQARSGAALAAISLAVEIAALVCIGGTATYSNVVDPKGANLPANQLIVYVSQGAANGLAAGPAPAGLHALQIRVHALAAALHAQSVLALDSAVDPAAPSQPAQGNFPGGRQAAALVQRLHPGLSLYTGELYVATPALLRRYGIKPGDISPATDILTSRIGLAGVSSVQLDTGGPACPTGRCTVRHPTFQAASLPTYTSDPNTLITVSALRALRLQLAPAGWLLQTARPLTAVQTNAARQQAAAAGMIIETRSAQPSLAQLRNWATAAGLLLACGVIAMVVGLIRSETASDLRTLTATGASSATRRTLTAATAGALALLGALLGTAIAYLSAVAWYRSQLSTSISQVPVADLIVILAGLPLAAAAGGWLLAGREPPVIARQPLE